MHRLDFKKIPEKEKWNSWYCQNNPRIPRIIVTRPSDLAKHIKILTSKQMLQRLPIAPAQVKASNAS